VIIAHISIIPVGTGSTSISNFIVEAVETLKKSGLNVMITPMGTVLEAENLEKIFKSIEECHEALHKIGVKRLLTLVLIDDRRDVERSMVDKIRSIEKKLGYSFQQCNNDDRDDDATNEHEGET